MSTHKYEVGDLVQLKSGGPVMTVTERAMCDGYSATLGSCETD
jgi:uncharacterized protein YodC (DUF2158 family)